jgi:hypothetical protein
MELERGPLPEKGVSTALAAFTSATAMVEEMRGEGWISFNSLSGFHVCDKWLYL